MKGLLLCVLFFALTSLFALPIYAGTWTETTFSDFANGRFDAGGNIFASPDGKLTLTGQQWDLNNDGFLDIVFSNHYDGASYNINSVVYWGSAGGFSSGNKTELPTHSASGNSIADLNGDGFLDIVFSNLYDGMSWNINSYIYWGSGSGFSSGNKTELPTHYAYGNSVADLNGDGFLDIVFSNAYDGTTWNINSYIYWGSASGFSSGNKTELPTHGAMGNSVADLNGDGFLDIVFSNLCDGMSYNINSVVYWGSASGFSSGNKTELPTHGASGNSVADLNGDGYLDIVFSNHEDDTTWNLNSVIYWGSATGFSSSNKTELPTHGAYLSTTKDLGDAYTRRNEFVYISSAYDTGAASNFGAISWVATPPIPPVDGGEQVGVQFQIRTADTQEALTGASWYGPTGTSDRYTVPGTPINLIHSGDRWIQYRVFLMTDYANTPILDSVMIDYTSAPYDPNPIFLTENGPAVDGYLSAGYYQKYKFAVTADGRQYTITATPTNGDVDLYYRNFDPNISPFVPGSYDASSRHPGASVEALSFIAPSDGKDYTVYPAVLAVTNSHYTIRVTSSVPGGLTLQEPADGSHVTASPTFEWSQVPNASYYELVLAKDADFTQPIWNCSAIDGSETSVVYSGSAVLEAGQTYYWRMCFQDVTQVWSNWTGAWSFIKDAPGEQLPAPVLSAPADGANVALPEKFSWQAVSGAVRYIVQVVAPQTSEVLETSEVYNVLWSGQSSTNSIIVPQTSEVLKTSEVYQWRVAGIDSGGNIGNYSESYSFTLVETTSPPAKPTPTSPSNGMTIDTQKITFSWTSSPTATAYNLRYSVDATFPKSSAKAWTVSDITATSHTVTLPLASATTIYWQISAKNAGGDSGWTDAISFNYAPPVTSKVTSVKIDLPKNGQNFLKGASLGAHAYMTGTYEGKITGAWYLDGEHYADFTANMTPANGAEVSITGLPTSEIKPRTIQVRLTSPTEISSNAVTYYVVDVQPGAPAKLRLTTNPTAIEADGVSTSTITVEVLDGYGYLVSGDKDREIIFSVSGEGILSSPTALTQNGKATVTLQSTTTPDDNVVVTANANGLESSSVNVQIYAGDVEPYLTWARTNASMLQDIGYDISGVNNFLSTQIEIPNPTPEAIESLKRLELMLDLMVKTYYGTAGDLTGGTMILLNDFSENIGSVIALAVTYPIVIHAFLVEIAEEVGLGFLGEYIEMLVESASTKCIDFVADLTCNIVDLVGSGPVADAVQEFVDIASLAAKEFITEYMTGELDPVEAAQLLIEKIVQAVGPMLAQKIYIHYTQPVLNQAVSLAESNTYGGTYESCKNSVEIALVGISTESEIIHNDVEANSLKMQTLPMIQELLLTWQIRDKKSILDFMKDTGAAILNFLDLRKWYYSINSSTEALIVVRRISNERIPDSISGAFGVEVEPARAAPPLAQKAPNAKFYRSLMLRMESSAADYDSIVREILFSLENDNFDGVLEKIEILLNANAQLSSDMAITSAPIGAAATNALKTIPDFDEMYNTSSFARDDAIAQQTLFLNALMNYLIDAEDDALRQTAIDSGYAALQANATALDEISQTVTGLFTTPAYPYLLVTSVVLSADELRLHDIFTITTKIMNAGAGMAHNVKVELSADESVELLSVATIDIGDLDNGSERTVSWELEVVSNTGQPSFVNLNPTSDDAINVAKIISIYLNEMNYGDVSGDGTISALDAAMILQHTVGLITLSEEAQALADVSNNGEISAYDASLILQRVVGLIDKFPIEEGTTASPSQYGQPYCISLANAQAKPAEHVIIPLTFGGADVLCGEFTVEFDADVLEFEKKNEKPSFLRLLRFARNGFLYPLHTAIGNKINFAFASAEPNKPQSIVDLEFAVLRNATIGETKLRITAAKVNESMNITAIDGVVNILPSHTAVYQNYPNPFNPETWIPYQLADAADVTLEIYGITGNLIKYINLGRKAAGAYMTKEKAICWDGRNEVGEIVASGVYFYTLRAGEFRATRRMVIVK